MLSIPDVYSDHKDGDKMLSGFDKLDKLTGGFKKGEISVVAGRPAMGKTTLCWSLATNMAKTKINVMMFNYCEGKHFVWVDPKDHYVASGKHLQEWNLSPRIEDFGRVLDNLRNHCVVDILFVPQMYPANRQETAHILSMAKDYAVRANAHCVLEYGVIRAVDSRDDRRPRLDDMKCPKTVTKYAENILFPYREDYYDCHVKDQSFEVIVAKSSSGENGTAYLKMLYEHLTITATIPKIYAWS